MTLTQTPAPEVDDRMKPSDIPEAAAHATPVRGTPRDVIGHRQPSRRQVILGAIVAVVVFVIAVGAVIYGVGSLVHARDQRALMATERTAIGNAAILAKALHTVTLPTKPPLLGAPVGVLAIPALSVNEAVVEGVGSSQTVSGPGHVPGTAGLGQPGNAEIVGRNAAYGGVFGRLAQLKPGDRILTASVEGQSVYVVRRVATVGAGSLEPVYGTTRNNRLTLVTSASDVPWNSDRAVVVTALLRGKPYAATPQESVDPNQLGNSGESGAWAELLLSVLALAVVAVGALFLYRRCTLRSAYLLSTAPLVAFTVVAAESISRMFPAWM
ncbi:MAG TPA: sortase [Acidimicrobiales bacterium]|nr:sortase [Acidimicrobiales bacterium]